MKFAFSTLNTKDFIDMLCTSADTSILPSFTGMIELNGKQIILDIQDF